MKEMGTVKYFSRNFSSPIIYIEYGNDLYEPIDDLQNVRLFAAKCIMAINESRLVTLVKITVDTLSVVEETTEIFSYQNIFSTEYCGITIKLFSYCRYDSTTGVFTVPPGGDGVYYFSTYMLVQLGEMARFDMMLNDDVICKTFPDHDFSGTNDYASGSFSAVVDVVTGKE